jgi:MinD-like ATPase involved in chromosome partitioning or flagellar assembly
MGKLDSDALELLHERDPELVLADFDGDPVVVAALRPAAGGRQAVPGVPGHGPGAAAPAPDGCHAGRACPSTCPSPWSPGTWRTRCGAWPGSWGAARAAAFPGGGRIVAFTGAKGGTGVTTTAVNAAVHAHAMAGRRTLLLDLDLESGSAGVLTNVAALQRAGSSGQSAPLDESLLESLVTAHESGLHVLPSPLDPRDKREVKPDQLRTVLRLLKHHYQLVVVDLARPLSLMSQVVLEQVDELYLVLNADLPSLRNAKRMLPHVRGAPGTGCPVKVVLNRVMSGGEITDADVRRPPASPWRSRCGRTTTTCSGR